MTPPNAYDLVPYRTKPRRTSHPDPLAAHAILAGLDPAPLANCRVLEIGCGTGGNLTAMAASLPGSRFLGIDPSAVQIDCAREDARRLGLGNVTFEAIGVEDLSDGPFDYILCHGVYSWVAPQIQDLLLAFCGRALASQGVAMLSYNVLPGWRYRSVSREAMRYSVRNIPNPMEKVKNARGYLSFLAGAVLDASSSHGKNLHEEVGILSNSYDYYIAHEHFETEHHPCYFHEFVGHAAKHELQYLGEAGFHPVFAGLSEQTRDVLMRISVNRIDLEQHVDFVRNRTFRHTMLVRAERQLSLEGRDSSVEQLLVRSACIESPTTRSHGIASRHEYKSFDDVEMTTASPLINAILMTLTRQAPRSVACTDLMDTVQRLFETEQPDQRDEAGRLFVKGVFDLAESGFLSLHAWQPEFATKPAERPKAWPIAADAARSEGLVPCILHSMVRVDPLDRFILTQCDGERTIPEIVERLLTARIEGDMGEIRKNPDVLVRERLDNLHQYALFL